MPIICYLCFIHSETKTSYVLMAKLNELGVTVGFMAKFPKPGLPEGVERMLTNVGFVTCIERVQTMKKNTVTYA